MTREQLIEFLDKFFINHETHQVIKKKILARAEIEGLVTTEDIDAYENKKVLVETITSWDQYRADEIEGVKTWMSEADRHDDVEITVKCSRAAAEEGLVKLLTYIAANGNGGHSFGIVVDPDGDTDQTKTFGFDGDGAARITDVTYQGKVVTWKDFENE